ncbi:prenyltransferase/squalene oxidase repeat-containing protein [Streptomyces sp. MUM 178J]|uniref:prenyltransferase/squalene oxidase repeat-containing protein n=1 Tax=Streptomyces sp. MUM 178J TaxID=2791991 RepID=UPI001F04D506|nr:prenyltransferase/squalene oxidase repeat-containing protein [Streptomyces sp. MUM 178J]WRQ79215.1 prenyltransferase/squalene oxidase repeat-containing protein [Streptomyces sp. MUM 178J]
MNTARRRRSAALAAFAAAGLVFTAAPAAVAAPSPTTSAALPSGLYGEGDPTYDGVWRQSLALLAQDTVGVRPAAKAVDWLTGQQCDSGGFPSYRADATGDCDAKLPLDSNATAAAVQALAALGGNDAALDKGVAWLKSVQNQDGGWSYNPGGPSDANSTSIVIGALAAAGEKPEAVTSKGGKTPYDALLTFAQPCDAEEAGAFVYQPGTPGLVADSTAAAVLGAHGAGLVVAAGAADAKGLACEKAANAADAAHNGAVYLAKALDGTGHLDTPPMPGAENPEKKPDFGNTADAVVALHAQGMGEAAKKPLAWLQQNADGWAKENGPAAYAQLIFAAHAAGADPKSFGPTDLVAGLNATGPAPEAASPQGSASSEENKEKKDEDKDDDGSGVGAWWIVGAFFAASVGVGFLLSGRKKNRQP